MPETSVRRGDARKAQLMLAVIAALHGEGRTRGLPGDMTGRVFALSFSLEQMP